MKFFKDHKNKIMYAVLFLTFVYVGLFINAGMEDYGAYSLIPPILMFLFILTTHKVLEGFLWGSVLAIFMKYKAATLLTFNDKLFAQVTNPDNLWLIIVLLLIGGVIAVLDKSGASAVFGKWVSQKAKTSKAAQLLTFILPIALSNDAYLGTSTTGATMTPINDKHKTPREFTSFIIRGTAVPANIFNPISTVAIFIAGLLQVNNFAAEGKGTQAYIGLLPYMFFTGALLVIVLLTILGVIPKIGPMKKAFSRSKEGIDLSEEEAATTVEAAEENNKQKSPHIINFFIPIASLVAATIYFEGNIQIGALVTLIITGILFVVQGIFSTEEYLDTILEGMKDMLMLAVIMATAFILVDSITELGFSNYIVEAASSKVAAEFLPFIIFVMFSATEFLVTLNFSLYILAIPVLVPLAEIVGANGGLVIAALISAGIWGTTTSITSDIGLLNAYSSRIPLFRHFISNLPYQIMAWIIAMIAYLVAGFIV